MTNTEFDLLLEETFTKLKALLSSKGADYSSNNDRLSNFKLASENLGISPFTVWAVYKNKHSDAINRFCRDGHLESEPIEMRILDEINYDLLLLGLLKDFEKDAK